MGPFHVNNTFVCHLGRHLDFSELPKDARVASLGFVMYYVSTFKKCKNIFYRRHCTLWLIFEVSVPDYFKQFLNIRITCPCYMYPLIPHFYIVKLGNAGVYLFFLFLLQNIDCGYSLEPPRRCGSNVYPQSMF